MHIKSDLKKKVLTLGGLAIVIVLVDQWTKQWVINHFQHGQSQVLWENFFNLTYVRNRGAAFGFLNNATPWIRDSFFLLMPPGAMLLILTFLRVTPWAEKLRIISLCCVFAGALGNYLDRLRFGYVVDFLDFHYYDYASWPAFNVADMSIVLGVTLLFFLEVQLSLKKKPKKSLTGEKTSA